MACDSCEFYSFRSDECRRHAPLANGREGKARWPSLTHLKQHEWCGDYKLDSELVEFRRIAAHPDLFAQDRPWGMTEERTAEWLTKQAAEAKDCVSELESR